MSRVEKTDEETQDFFYKKKICILQKRKGYRFSVDSPILADFLPEKPGERALEIGTGCGIISLLALFRNKLSFVYGLELQKSLRRLAEINAEKNGFSERFKIIEGDFNVSYKNFQEIPLIFSNPPFLKVDSGRLSPYPEVRLAKTESRLKLKDLLKKSFVILGKKASVFLIFPYARLAELLEIAEAIGFSIAKIREVFSFKDRNPDRFLIQLTNFKVSSQQMKPLIIFNDEGNYTKEMNKIVSG